MSVGVVVIVPAPHEYRMVRCSLPVLFAYSVNICEEFYTNQISVSHLIQIRTHDVDVFL